MKEKFKLFLCLMFFLSIVSSQMSDSNFSSSGGGYATGDNNSVSSGGGVGYTGEELDEKISEEIGQAVERQIKGTATKEDLELIEKYKVNVQFIEDENNSNSVRSLNSKLNVLLIITISFGVIILFLAYLLFKKKKEESKTTLVS